MTTVYTQFHSTLGCITIQACDKGLMGCWFETQTSKPSTLGDRSDDHPILQQTQRQLLEYFKGTRQHFELPLAPIGTDFQQRVWLALSEIPFGESRAYQDLAIAIGQPTAVRAVGAANGRNPISIIVPCHRVIGRDGKLTGYAGGLDRKRWLLAHEGLEAQGRLVL